MTYGWTIFFRECRRLRDYRDEAVEKEVRTQQVLLTIILLCELVSRISEIALIKPARCGNYPSSRWLDVSFLVLLAQSDLKSNFLIFITYI